MKDTDIYNNIKKGINYVDIDIYDINNVNECKKTNIDLYKAQYINENENDNISNSILYIIENSVNHIIDKYCSNLKNVNTLTNQVNYLQDLKLPEQRSDEWYQIRNKLLTASSLAAALNDDHFKSKYQLILDKLEPNKNPYVSNPITEWGVKYEEIATKFYELLNKVEILEFGLIPHPNFPIFGASPDGICSNSSPCEYIGRMLEIKCPPKRKFTKSVPKHYWYQMQGQLECCDLKECDFLQVKIIEYDTYEDYCNDIYIQDKSKNGYNKHNLPKGCTITYKFNDNDIFRYLYPSLELSNEEYINWVKIETEKLTNKGYLFIESKWWSIERYECTLVERDQHWWANNVDLILEFWKEVEYYKDNIDELYKKINNKNSTFYVQNSNKCLI